MKKLCSIFILGLYVSSLVMAQTEPTSLVPNAMIFTSGALISDHVHEDIPDTDEFPEESAYTVYPSWYEDRLAPGPGTINILVEDDLIVGRWTGDAFDALRPNYFNGVQGIDTPTGTDGESNVWSEIRIQQRIFGDLIYMNSDKNYSYLRYYQDISLVTPINPAALGINLEGGDIIFEIDGEERLVVDDTNKRVGINVSTPLATLHVDGDVRYSDSFYGKLGDFETFSNTSAVTNTNNDATIVPIISESVVVPANSAAVIFGSVSVTWAPTNNGNDGKMWSQIHVLDTSDSSETSSAPIWGDVENQYGNTATSMRCFYVFTNDSSSSKTVTITLQMAKGSIATGIGNNTVTVSANDANLAIALIPYITGS